MSNTFQFINELTNLDIHLNLHDGKLRIDAPKGVITPVLEQRIRDQKNALIDLLKNSPNHPVSTISKKNNDNSSISAKQLKIWQHQKANPQSRAFNVCQALKIHGKINTDYLNKAWQQLLLSHDILRSNIVENRGQVELRLNSSNKSSFFLDDHSDVNHEDYQVLTESFAKEEINRGFEFESDSLIRLRLIRFSDDHYVLLLCTHNIICDERSTVLLLHELAELYINTLEQTASPIDVSEKIQFSDFNDWQQQWLKSSEAQPHINFWRQQLERQPSLPLHFNKVKASLRHEQKQQLKSASFYHFEIEPALKLSLEQFAAQHKINLFTVLLGAYQLVLNRYTTQDNFYINISNLGRQHPQTIDIIGPLELSLPLACQVNNDQLLSLFLQQVETNISEVHQHANPSLEYIAQSTTHKNDLNSQVSFNYIGLKEQTDNAYKKLSQDTLSRFEINLSHLKFDSCLNIKEIPGNSLACSIAYNSKLFKHANLDLFEKYFITLLNNFCLEQNAALKNFEFLSEKERLKQIHFWNQTQAPIAEKCMGTLFEQQAQRTPNTIAIKVNDQKISYKELNQRANVLAFHFKNNALNSQPIIGIFLQPGIELVVSMLAAMKTGLAYSPIDPDLSNEDLSQLISDLGLLSIISHSNVAKPSSLTSLNIIDIDSLTINMPEEQIITANNNPQSPLYYLQTGSATKKIVGVSHASLANLITWYTHTCSIESSDNILLITSPYINVSQKSIFSTLITGATLVFSKSISEPMLLISDEINNHNINLMNATPRSFYNLINNQENNAALKTLRWISLSGDTIHSSLVNDWLNSDNNNCQLVTTYEIPEASGSCCFNIVNKQESQPETIPLGLAINNTQVYVLDDALNPSPLNMQGEIYIGGESLSLGYLNSPALNKKAFIDNPFGAGSLYKSGALGLRRSNGSIFLTASATSLDIKSSQDSDHQNLFSDSNIVRALESVLFNQPGISQAAVVRKKETSTKQLKFNAYLSAKNNTSIDLVDLKERLTKIISLDFLPAEIYLVPYIPLDTYGQPDFAALENSDFVLNEKEDACAQFSSIEKIVATTWKQRLNLAHVDISSHFFNLGADSIQAFLVNKDLEQRLQQQIEATLIFKKPILKDFCEALESNVKPQPSSSMSGNVYQHSASHIDSKQTLELPLTTLQQKIISNTHDNLNTTSNHAALLHLNLSASQAEKSLTDLHKLHPVLNAVLNEENATQVINPDTRICFDVKELSFSQSPHERISQASMLHHQALKEVFDLSQHCIRYTLYKLEKNITLLSVHAHAFICDTFSFSRLLNDLLKLSINEVKEQEFNIDTTNYLNSYRQFCLQQSSVRNKQQQLQYWQQQLSDAPKNTALSADSHSSQKGSPSYTDYNFNFDASFQDKLSDFNKQQSVTPFTTFFAAFNILLSKHNKQTDICVALPISPQSIPENYQGMGNFLNTVIIRLQPGKNPLVHEFLTSTRRTVVNALKNQHVLFSEVLESLGITDTNKSIPFCNTTFNYISAQQSDSNLNKRASEKSHIESKTYLNLGSDICFSVKDTTEGIDVNIQYNSSLYSKSYIKTLEKHYQQILEELIKDIKQPVQTLKMLSGEDIFKLLDLDPKIYDHAGSMTNMQRDIFIDNTLNENQRWNYFGQSVGFNIEIDPAMLERAIQVTTNIESNLRTHLIPSKTSYSDIAYRCVINEGHPLTHIKLNIAEHQGDKETLKALVDEFVYQPYALACELGFRNMLVRFNDKKWIWVCAFHHIVIDGLGMHLYILKVLDAYEKLSQDAKIDYEPYAYDDYCEYHRYLSDTQQTVEYWHSIIKHIEPLSGGKYFADKVNPAQKIERIKTLDAEHSSAVRKYTFKNRSTPAAYTKSILTILLKSYFNQRDKGLMFNEVRVGRTRENAWTLGCCFTNQPFAVPPNILDKSSSFSHLLNFTTNYAQQVSPYEFISNSQQIRGISESDIQFSFNFYGAVPSVRLLGVDCDITEIIPNLENAIHTVGRMIDKKLQIHTLFSTDAWNDYRFLDRFEYISQQILAGTDNLADLQILLPDEQQKPAILSIAPYQHKALNTWINTAGEEFADNTAVIYNNKSYTYRQLHTQANQLAHFLLEQKVNRHDFNNDAKVALCLAPSFDFMIAVLAVIKTGATYIPIDPKYPQERIRYILNDASVDKLITTQDIAQAIEIDPSLCIYLDDSDASFHQSAEQYSTQAPQIESSLEDILYIIYTSGSTGKPKGAKVKVRGEINLLQWYCQEFEFSPSDRNLVISAIGFDLTQKNFFAPLVSGGCVVLPTETNYDPDYLLSLIEEQQVSLINCAPSAFYPLLEHSEETQWSTLKSLRLVLFGGESIRIKELIEWLNSEHSQAQLVNMYGPTECTDIAAFHRIVKPSEYIDKAIPIGKPNDNVRLYVVDPDMRQLPAGIPGELAIGGQGVGDGYLNHVDLNQKVFVDNPFAAGKLYLTGDLVKLDENNDLIFLNRIDFQLKLRGLRIEPGEIEHALKNLEHVKDALVLVHDEQLVAYSLIEEAKSLSEDWRKQLSQSLPPHLIPHALVTLYQWPLTANGKINRRALPSPERQQNYVAPRNQLENQLVHIWQDILNIEQVGIYDNFFELGGHSLIAVRLAKRIQEELNIELPIAALFNAQDVASLAEVLSNNNSEQSCLIPLKPGDNNKPPIFIIHPASGLAIGFQTLTRHLETDYRVYGVQAYGFDAYSERSVGVEEAAQRYLEVMQKLQPEGPYYISGYSLGGVIALEIARLLKEQGQSIKWFVIIDAAINFKWELKQLKFTPLLLDFYKIFEPQTPVKLSELQKIPPEDQVEWLASQPSSNISLTMLQRSVEVLEGFKMMMEDYEAEPLNIDCIFISSEYKKRPLLTRILHRIGMLRTTLGWEKVIKGKLVHIEAKGDHRSVMYEPNVKHLASLIDKSLIHIDKIHEQKTN